MTSCLHRRTPFRRKGGPASRQSGSVLIMASIAMLLLIGLAGLAIDVGYLEHMKRRLQTAADAGALAGDLTLAQAGGGSCTNDSASSYTAIQTEALNNVTYNGFTNGSSNVTVTVNCGSSISTGYYVNDKTAVEVIVKQTSQPSFFMAALGYAQGAVTARAVAHLGSGNACMVALDPNSGDNGLTLQGNAKLNTNCGMYSNSNIFHASDSFCTDAQIVGAVGTATPKNTVNKCSGSGTVPVEQGLLPLPDPFASLAAPISLTPSTPCDVPSPGWSSGDLATVTPKIPNIYVICGNLSGGTLPQGDIYVVTGSVSGTLTMDGGSGGVMFYLTCPGGCSGAGQYGSFTPGAATLSAPTSGTYKDVLVYGDRSASNTPNSFTINGNSSLNLSGALYLPRTNLTINGTANASWTAPNMALVAWQITTSGNFTLNANSNGFPGGWPIQFALLGE